LVSPLNLVVSPHANRQAVLAIRVRWCKKNASKCQKKHPKFYASVFHSHGIPGKTEPLSKPGGIPENRIHGGIMPPIDPANYPINGGDRGGIKPPVHGKPPLKPLTSGITDGGKAPKGPIFPRDVLSDDELTTNEEIDGTKSESDLDPGHEFDLFNFENTSSARLA